MNDIRSLNNGIELMASGNCVDCDALVETGDDCVIGEVLTCTECGVELEVTGTDPLELALAPEVEEDWGE